MAARPFDPKAGVVGRDAAVPEPAFRQILEAKYSRTKQRAGSGPSSQPFQRRHGPIVLHIAGIQRAHRLK